MGMSSHTSIVLSETYYISKIIVFTNILFLLRLQDDSQNTFQYGVAV